ncbi:MAG: hypothetical protein ABI880_12735, partial [Acidobacteriota bacterium]
PVEESGISGLTPSRARQKNDGRWQVANDSAWVGAELVDSTDRHLMRDGGLKCWSAEVAA